VNSWTGHYSGTRDRIRVTGVATTLVGLARNAPRASAMLAEAFALIESGRPLTLIRSPYHLTIRVAGLTVTADPTVG
jgi:hypothetical protein